jgi:DNA primase
MEEFDVIVDLISEFLGKPKKINEMRGQISYNCPICDDGKGKGNLEINIEKYVYHCWSCGDINDTHGTLSKLFDEFANKKQKKVFNLLMPDEFVQKEKKKKKLRLPEGYVQFKDSNAIYPPHREALNYLKSRGITDEIIEKYQIGYTMKGECAGRIIVPSYNIEGELNYYVARSWATNTKFKYKNPEAEKEKIIFNEHLINWDNDIYLVEGVFDGFFLENSIPMLGKHLSELLFTQIYEKAKGNVIICLDGDAWKDATKLYRELNGGILHGRVKIVKLPKDQDVCDLKGNINDYYTKIK